MGTESFFLEKWYSDVFDGAAVQLSYRAQLRLGPLALGYVGGIAATGRASRSFVVGRAVLPVDSGGTVCWPAEGAQPERSWSGSRARSQPLWRRGSRILDWNPVVLNGQVSGSGLPPSARGYVERMAINFGPWQLGLDRLKWGRFCGARHSLVWIEWEGSHPLRLALLAGAALPLQQVSRTEVRGGNALLRLGSRLLLIDEPMADGALRGFPLPRRLTGLRFLRGVETKWMALGEMQLPGGELDEGHAVFEEVVWA